MVEKLNSCFAMGFFWVFLLEKEKLQCKRKLKQETTMVEKLNSCFAKMDKIF